MSVKGVVHFLSFFSRKEIKVFDENISGFFTLLVTKWFKVQKTVSVQTVQRALNDSRR